MSAKIPENTIVQVENLSASETYELTYDSSTWKIPPGSTKTIPYYAMCLWFGDPRAVNIGDRDANQETQYRTNEIRRLGVFYGIYDDPWFDDKPRTVVDDSTKPGNEVHKKFEQRDSHAGVRFTHPWLPHVRCTDSDGAPILTVLDDPNGDMLTPEDVTARSERKYIDQEIARLQQQVAQLQVQSARNAADVPAADPAFEGDVGAKMDGPAVMPEPRADDDEIPDDTPDVAKPRQRPTPPKRG